MTILKKAEVAAILVTLLCMSFTAGYFIGRSSGSHVITVSALDTAPSTPPATSPPTSASVGLVSESHVSSSPAASPPAVSSKLDINTASLDALVSLPGIGNVLARNIIDFRTKNGPFKIIDDIKNVDGIGDKKFSAIKDLITVG